MHLGKKKFKHTNFQDMYKSMDYKAKVKEVNTHEKRGRLLSLETLLHKKIHETVHTVICQWEFYSEILCT